MNLKERRAKKRNGLIVLKTVRIFGKSRHWSTKHIRYIAVLCIQCCLDESNLLNLGSRKVPGSLDLPHDGLGSDHLSVGVFQQQVPGWGPVSRCQNVAKATNHFLQALEQRGLAKPDGQGPAPRHRIQSVQVSFDKSGANYGAQRAPAKKFVRVNWARSALPVKGAK